MPGQYLTDRVVRPRICGNAKQTEATARLAFIQNIQAFSNHCAAYDVGTGHCSHQHASPLALALCFKIEKAQLRKRGRRKTHCPIPGFAGTANSLGRPGS